WLIKQLDAAVRGKLPLTVSVTMPDGSITELQLEPASIVGGRLRARDRNSEIERTLPLSSIAGVSPARSPPKRVELVETNRACRDAVPPFHMLRERSSQRR